MFGRTHIVPCQTSKHPTGELRISASIMLFPRCARVNLFIKTLPFARTDILSAPTPQSRSRSQSRRQCGGHMEGALPMAARVRTGLARYVCVKCTGRYRSYVCCACVDWSSGGNWMAVLNFRLRSNNNDTKSLYTFAFRKIDDNNQTREWERPAAAQNSNRCAELIVPHISNVACTFSSDILISLAMRVFYVDLCLCLECRLTQGWPKVPSF